tara:strand:- start:1553 stop:1978 length:426 start_codon:yes stop_codon:yes gene_type:complete
MSNFFVPSEIYEERIKVCKDCVYYSKILGNCKICGCFMKIKARISQMHCPKYYWKMHDFGFDEKKLTKEIPEDIKKEVCEIYPLIKSGRAPNKETTRRLVELYNIIYGGSFDSRTSCSSCLETCWRGILKYHEEIKGYEEL